VSHIPLLRVSRARNPDYEARRLKRRFAAVWRRYKWAMTRRRRRRRARSVALFLTVAATAYAVGWGLLDHFGVR
jgi:hypothetical protein